MARQAWKRHSWIELHLCANNLKSVNDNQGWEKIRTVS